MTHPRVGRRWALATLAYVVVALVIGYVAAMGVNSALSISFADKEIPVDRPLQTGGAGQVARTTPPATLSEIAVPARFRNDPLMLLAVHRVQDAVTAAGGPQPEIRWGGESGFTVREGSALPAEGYTLSETGVRGSGRSGMANGLLAAADAISATGDLPDLSGRPVAPELKYRFADFGAVGVEPDEEAWLEQSDYSHNSGQFSDVILAEPPYVDPEGMAQVQQEWQEYIDHIRAYGYNGVVVNGFLEYVNFDQVGDGYEVYPADSPYRARHEAMVEEFGEMWKYADDMGMRVVFKTDMLANTGPLNDYLTRELGGIDANDPRLWEVYRAGLAEFFENMPFVDGLMIRIGEAGTVYNLEGWDYFSTLAVTSVGSVRTMLTAFTEVAAAHDKTIYFRTWSVGVGDVGDMHTNPETYDEVLAGLPDENLVVVTKFTMGDFYSWLPLNPTLSEGEHDRIVEFQSRREFEGFSSFPNYLSGAHQTALQEFEGANPRIEGIWVWTQDGGPWRAGPMSLYLKTGFWQLYDLDVYATARLGWDHDADLTQVSRDWIAQNFSDDPDTVDTLLGVFAESRQAQLDGLYLGPYARKQVKALGLEPPPMMWIFEWDMVSGDTAALSAIHHVTKGQVDTAIAQSESALATTNRMLAAVRGTDPAQWHDPQLRDRLIQSLEYEADLFDTLGAYRAAFLSYYDWLDSGDAADWQAWQAAWAQYQSAVDRHETTYAQDLDTPAYSFFAVEAGMAHAERTRSSQVVTALVLAGILVLLVLGGPLGRRWRSGAVGTAARGVWIGMSRPWRLADDPTAPRSNAARHLAWLLPALFVVLSRGAFSGWLSWTYLLATLGSMALFTITARLLLRGRDPFALYAAVGSALLLKTVILSVVVVLRGPLLYWYKFWTDEQYRTVYVTVSVAAFLWLFWVTYAVMRRAYSAGRFVATGRVLVAIGAPVLALGALMQISGLEAALTAFNDQMALLPLGLSRILGLTVHLGIPTEIPLYLLGFGAVLAVLGLVMGAARRTGDVEPA